MVPGQFVKIGSPTLSFSQHISCLIDPVKKERKETSTRTREKLLLTQFALVLVGLFLLSHHRRLEEKANQNTVQKTFHLNTLVEREREESTRTARLCQEMTFLNLKPKNALTSKKSVKTYTVGKNRAGSPSKQLK